MFFINSEQIIDSKNDNRVKVLFLLDKGGIAVLF
jgi:hypothetical protein